MQIPANKNRNEQRAKNSAPKIGFDISPKHLDCKQVKIAILLCTYQGERFLTEQLDSFASQTCRNWKVWVSDDGSQDESHKILERHKNKWYGDRITILSGPRRGFVANFLSLVCKDEIHAEFYAFSDQDDIWEEHKLQRAIDWLDSIPCDVPALYCGRTRLVDKDHNEIGLSPLFSKAPSFANALIQNIGGGNTMVFNNAARSLLKEAGESVAVTTHDWWAYMLVSGCGGRVYYDAKPMLRYRQHENNLVGMNSSWPARFKRICLLLQGQSRKWNNSNIAALRTMSHRLTQKNFEILELFACAREMSLFSRLIQIKRSGIYRQTLLGNIGLIAAAVFKKL